MWYGFRAMLSDPTCRWHLPGDIELDWGAETRAHVARVTRQTGPLVPITQSAPAIYTVQGKLVGTTVTIEGVSGTVSVNPLYFSARTAAGDSIKVALGAPDNQLDATDVEAGQKLRGVVVFDVPSGTNISLVLMSDTGLNQVATWTVR
jgi:hypothetical protein